MHYLRLAFVLVLFTCFSYILYQEMNARSVALDSMEPHLPTLRLIHGDDYVPPPTRKPHFSSW